MTTTAIPEAMADALAYWTRDAIFSLGSSDETLTVIEIKRGDGDQGNWAVLAHTHDQDCNAHTYQTVIDSAGEVVLAEERLP